MSETNTNNHGYYIHERTQMVDTHPFVINHITITSIDNNEPYYYRIKYESIFDKGPGYASKKDVILVSNDSVKLVREIRDLDNKISAAWEERKKLYKKLQGMCLEQCDNKSGGVHLEQFHSTPAEPKGVEGVTGRTGP